MISISISYSVQEYDDRQANQREAQFPEAKSMGPLVHGDIHSIGIVSLTMIDLSSYKISG
jgi:hypothetical protein